MAHSNTGVGPMQNVRPKLAIQPKVSAGSSIHAKMAALEKNLSGGAVTTTRISSTPKPVLQRTFGTACREDIGPSFPNPPPFKSKPVETLGDNKSFGSPIPAFPKSQVMKPPVKATFPDKFNVSPTSDKPAWMNGSRLKSTPTAPNLPNIPKPKISSISSLQSQFSQSQECGPPSFPKPSQSTNFKPPPMAPQNYIPKEQSVTDRVVMVNAIKSITPKTPTTQKPNVVGKSGPQVQPVSQRESTDPFAPKKKTLPALFSLGNPPLKPKRPSSVDIKKFKNNGPLLNDGQGLNKMGPCATLSTPQHRTAAMSQPLDQEESYDDVGAMNLLPGHLAQNTEEYSDDLYEDLDERWTEQEDTSKRSQDETRGEQTKHTEKEKNTEEEFGDQEIYEDIEQPWTEQETKEIDNSKGIKGQEKKTKKDEKKQLQQEKKLQKANEKREQEAKKKFKIKGPVQVIQKGKARLECKGGKTDLPLKQGEIIEIIRILDNPEGRWLGRNTAGAYGYVKTESVDIDYDHLKQQSLAGVLSNMSGTDPEVYDDVGAQMDACGGPEGQNAGDDEIYDDLDGPDQDISYPSPPPPIIDEEDMYDDVESQGFPPPPLNDLSQFTPKGKSEVMDPKKKKKFEKEEKEFRKKFKFEGEIHVLYDVTIATTLTTKKWGNKDLQLKPGEVIDVIVKPVGGKLIGRSREGQFGYVAVGNIAQDMGDIYDDIGEDCIYDND